MSNDYLKTAIKILDGQVAAANAVNANKTNENMPDIKQAHVWGWINRTKVGVSPEYVIPLAKSTGWRVTPHQLRPDIYPHPVDGLPEHLRDIAA
jgi:DNA-binding transcriptional regulator YdaS (Cro superfamily)